MKRSLVLVAALAVASVAAGSPGFALGRAVTTGDPEAPGAQGEDEVCGAVGDSSESISAVFDYVDDLAVPASTVIIADREFDSSVFSGGALAAFELAHAAGTDVCVHLPAGDEPAQADVDVEVCGPPNYGALTAGLQLGDQFVLIDTGVFGFRWDQVTGAAPPNMAAALGLASDACVSASVHGTADDEQVEAAVSTQGCFTVIDLATERLALLNPTTEAEAAFHVIDGSVVPADLVHGEAALQVTGHRGVDGAIGIARVDVLDCSPVRPAAPAPLPLSEPVSGPVPAETDGSVPVNAVVLIVAALVIAVVGYLAFRRDMP